MAECKRCDGTGSIKCPNCKGLGGIYNVLGFWDRECSKCEGTGEVRCPNCGGTGEVDGRDD